MAASRTPRPTRAESAPDLLLAPLRALSPPLPLAVAYSGGADSSALLRAAVRCWPGQVQAIHVHHGLQAAADTFTAHCRRTCEELQVALEVRHVDARHAPGDSPEDAARRARYAALADAAREANLGCVLLAQHADDQAETLLLALSRGAGLPGLAAMPARFERHGVAFLRPWLQVPGAVLRQWLAGQGAGFVEDPSNSDTGYTRNRIRHQVLPALEQAFPQFRETFARSARHAAQAQSLLDEVAAADLAAMGGEPVIARLQPLSRGRQANLLRHWLRSAHGALASAAQMDELLDQVADCTTRGHRLRLKVATGFVARDGAVLRFSDEPDLRTR
ncbi:tRNA lysidine(34) synthetase TilS [Ramlibacter tataouinensis]|uniref:tRNA lysidine(34) synthetase TilS n=1 Tax=Ramlibacter tataouinensis TaxID=94132 RepID=UPI0022F3CB0F|nr:tRNA lysidine(34) synthetase TilS [Ramlibacter tataouinensis]WBY01595.1 tRNA lysidine(34) synthetase TilS [Ramlibacter tataouinensis]